MFGMEVSLSFFFVVVFTLIVSTINSESIRIHSANDLISFSNDVNKGSTYSGTTVYLDSDIEFDPILSELFNPIGNITSTKHFNGVFDGQGHTISNLNLTSMYTGLFGYSTGATIKNVVIDKSCSFVSLYDFNNGGDINVGSIIRQCSSSKGPCIIANTVNMGNVTFIGNSRNNIYVGGIAGYFTSANKGYTATIINCANYGTVTNTGFATTGGYLGGIVARYAGTSPNVNNTIKNCVNHGDVINEGNTQYSRIGGIVGTFGKYGLIENCVNTGLLTDQLGIGTFGGIGGHLLESTEIIHCLSTGSYYFYCTTSSSTSGVTVTNSSTSVTFNTTIVNELNEYSENNDGLNKWILNSNNNDVSFNINGGKAFTLASQLILLPDPVGDSEYTFSGWFTDSYCTNKFDSKSVSSDTTLYGGWGYKVTFSLDDGTIITSTKDVTYGQQYGIFSSITNLKEGYTLKWFTEENGEGEEITAESIVNIAGDHTLYGYYVPNNYTVTFDFGNGTTLNETVEYDKEINFPEDAEREGYTFNGWNNSGITRMPGHDITFTANWTATAQISSSSSSGRISSSSSLTRGVPHLSSPSSSPSFSSSSSSSPKNGEKSISSSSIQIPSEYVEIVFSKKDMSEKEVKEIVNKYIKNTDYEIKITKMNDGTTVVIIKFVDVETASSFIENINTGSEFISGFIRRADFTVKRISSSVFSPMINLIFLVIIN